MIACRTDAYVANTHLGLCETDLPFVFRTVRSNHVSMPAQNEVDQEATRRGWLSDFLPFEQVFPSSLSVQKLAGGNIFPADGDYIRRESMEFDCRNSCRLQLPLVILSLRAVGCCRTD